MTHMKKNILVVDDSALMRRVMCDIINSDSKFQATDYCRDGLEAYEKLKHTSYDGVVLDVNMPRMDGLQLLEKLQKEGIRANVVMVSTLTDSREADVTILAMERGAIDFVAKPTNIIEAKGEAFKRQLLGILNAVLATQKTAGGIRVAAKPAAKAPMMRKADRWKEQTGCTGVLHRRTESVTECDSVSSERNWMPRLYWYSICRRDLPNPWLTGLTT